MRLTSINCPRCGRIIIIMDGERPYCENCCYPDEEPDEALEQDAKYEALLDRENGTTV